MSNEQETDTDLPDDVDSRISRLIEYLRASRCLLVLDNAEAVMQSGDLAFDIARDMRVMVSYSDE